jgi:hypothetical protein
MPSGLVKCGGCGESLSVSNGVAEKCYTCEDLAYCDGLEDGRSGTMKSSGKRRFIQVDERFYELIKQYAKDNEATIPEVVAIALKDFMTREVVVA